MSANTLNYFSAQVQAPAIFFQRLDNSNAVTAVMKTIRHEIVQHTFAKMPERCVTKVVAHADSLDQVLVQIERTRNRAAYLCDLKRVGQARYEVIADRRYKHLALVLQASERVRVNNPITVTLEGRTDGTWFFSDRPACRVRRTDSEGRKSFLSGLKSLAYAV
jgi:hypothetical protein|tara:strand:- start:734 stop:1222 length:489 start_codon:yes stop_codon:yes gene_type:complete